MRSLLEYGLAPQATRRPKVEKLDGYRWQELTRDGLMADYSALSQDLTGIPVWQYCACRPSASMDRLSEWRPTKRFTGDLSPPASP
jgi:hypothetical protein